MAKKKKSGKRPTQPGVDPNEKRRERLEAKRAAKAAALEAQRKRQLRETWIRRIAILALLGVAVWFLFLRNATPNEIEGYPINDFSVTGANQHTTGQISYEDSPPVSGQHAPQPAPCGVHSSPIPNEQMVHTLEHGSVGLLYNPEEVEIAEIRDLEAIVEEYDGQVFSMPYVDPMDSPIVIAAWAHTMELDEVDESAINAFIEEFRGGGDAPEANQNCPSQDPAPYQDPADAEEPDASATASPDASPEPTPSD